MKACNGVTQTKQEAMEITKIEPIVIEVEENGKIFSRLILYELIYKINLSDNEMVVDGEVQETIYETRHQEH